MRYFNKLCDAVNKLYVYLGVVLLLAISAACILQVFTRYVLGYAVVGTEEISRYCFIWLGFLGSAVCVRNWTNAHISIANDLMQGKAKLIHSTFLDVMVFICAIFLFVQGMNCVKITQNQLSSMMRIPMCYIYAAIPAGAFGIMLSSAQRILNRFFGKDQQKEVQE